MLAEIKAEAGPAADTTDQPVGEPAEVASEGKPAEEESTIFSPIVIDEDGLKCAGCPRWYNI